MVIRLHTGPIRIALAGMLMVGTIGGVLLATVLNNGGGAWDNAKKYIESGEFKVDGVVEKHDVIGAIFGQTEGLFPKEFELRELQKSGKIGRIDIELSSANDKTTGNITVPSSLDRAETAIIAAAMETVDRVGPCESNMKIDQITDVRVEKRSQIVQRAKELMRGWVVKEGQEIERLLDEVDGHQQAAGDGCLLSQDDLEAGLLR